MANCFNKYIGVWDGCSPKDANKLYLNDLPGVELGIGDYLTDSEQTDGLEVLQGIVDTACDDMFNDIRVYLSGSMYMNDILSNNILAQFMDNRRIRAAQPGKYIGVQFNLGQSPYLSARIHFFQIFPVASGSSTLRVFNINTGNEVYTQPFDFIGGQVNTIEVERDFLANSQPFNLAFVVDGDDVGQTYDTQLWGGTCLSCNGGYGNPTSYGRYANPHVYAAQLSWNKSIVPLVNNVQSAPAAYISLTYSVYCDPTMFICSVAPLLKRAVWYNAGIGLCDEIIYSRRLNYITTIQKEDAVAAKAEWTIKRNEQFNAVLNNMKLPQNICFQCNPVIQNRSAIP